MFFKPNEDWADMDNVSTIIFTNAATISKFRRMGYYKKYYNALTIINREGYILNRDKYATVPEHVSYELRNAPFKETWGNDLVALHNPNAIHPLEKGYFIDALDIWYEDGEIYNSNIKNGYHFLNSTTHVFSYRLLESKNENIINITRAEFEKKIRTIKRGIIEWICIGFQ